ncbi:hypothetical protein P8452_20273 [Trifolium repens]|nr:hypothetical protein P8452_20273 [Trifolium repens]
MTIEMCDLLEDVVDGKEEDETNKIVFYNLKSLELNSLPRLNAFCSSSCPIMFPLLEVVIVKGCPRMEHFSFGVTNTTILRNVQFDGENHWEGELNGTIKKLFDEKVAFRNFNRLALADYPELKDLWYGQLNHNVFCNLKSLKEQECDFLSLVLLPSNVMQALHGLEKIKVTDCDSLEAVFDVKGMKSREILIKQSTQLKKLTLSSLPKLKHIWNEDPHEIISFENLYNVEVSMCQSLLYIFPSSTSFTYLTYLKVCECDELIYIMTSTTAKSLVQLTKLEITCCEKMLEVVKIDEEKADQEKIIFENLKHLELSYLPSFRSFCYGKQAFTFPSLTYFFAEGCPQMEILSPGVAEAPCLTRIHVHEGWMRWKGDLNKTIQHAFMAQEVPHSNVE